MYTGLGTRDSLCTAYTSRQVDVPTITISSAAKGTISHIIVSPALGCITLESQTTTISDLFQCISSYVSFEQGYQERHRTEKDDYEPK